MIHPILSRLMLLGLGFVLVTTTAFAEFSDVASDHANFEAINFVQDNKIVSGYPDGTFRPDLTINRAELVKIVIEVSHVEETIKNCLEDNIKIGQDYVFFTDVPKSAWYAPHVCVAKFAHFGSVINDYPDDYPDGIFQSRRIVTFIEASKMIIGSLYGYSIDRNAVWYNPFVYKLAIKKAIPTTISSLTKNITRGELVEIIYRLKMGNIEKDFLEYNDLVSKKVRRPTTDNNFSDVIKIDSGSSFREILDDYYTKDKNSVYWRGEKIKNADPASFEIINRDYSGLGSNYVKDKNSVYWRGNKIKGVDLASFEIMNNNYTKDKNSAYWDRKKIAGVDVNSFELLSDNYAKDKNSVYNGGIKVEDADAITFEVLTSTLKTEEGSDFVVSEIMNSNYAKDKNSVYYDVLYGLFTSAVLTHGSVKIEDADPASFVLLNNYYAKDKNSVYRSGVKIEGVDPETFNPNNP